MQAADQRPIRVLVLIPTLDIGGAEVDVARTLPRLDRRRFEVIVCAFMGRGTLAQPLQDAGIEVIGPSDPRTFGIGCGPISPPSRLRAAAWLRRLSEIAPIRTLWRHLASAVSYVRIGIVISARIRKMQIDVVHAILPNSYVVAGIATLFAPRRPLVMSRVSLNWYHRQYPILSALERRVLHRFVTAVICNSAAVQQDLVAEGVAASKIRLIPNGIDVQGFSGAGIDRRQARERLGIAREALVFSLVASVRPYKGHADLLRALWLIRDRLPAGWVLLAPGRDIDGYLGRMQRLGGEFGLSAHIRFLGERHDIAAVLRAADIHVSASHTEGFPNNILEAMCSGLPVIATAVGGVPEMVVEGETGLLVPPANPEAMARALHSLANDPGRRAAMGEAGRRLASSFSIERCAAAIERLYADVVAERRRACV
jgi:glycosyltransferase involved in cell wall biosynthesis